MSLYELLSMFAAYRNRKRIEPMSEEEYEDMIGALKLLPGVKV